MKRRLGAFLAIIGLFVVCIPLQNLSAASAPCGKVGVVKKSGSRSYRCALVGKQRRWVVVKNSTKKITNITTTTTTVVVNKYPDAKAGETCTDVGVTTLVLECVAHSGEVRWMERVSGGRISVAAVASRLNESVQSMSTRNGAIPSIEFNFSLTVSAAEQTIIRAHVDAFFKYGDFPNLVDFRPLVNVGTSTEEVKSLLKEVGCIWDWDSFTEIAGLYALCADRVIVAYNYTALLCGFGFTATECTQLREDGGEYGSFRARINFIHELSHPGKVIMMGENPATCKDCLYRLPAWFVSGISNVYGSMIAALVAKSDYIDFNIRPSEGTRCIDYPIERLDIPAGGCKGSGTGDFAAELLVARFGFSVVFKLLEAAKNYSTISTRTPTGELWESKFAELFLQTPSSFSTDVEVYRNAVINGANLPNDFLVAKARP
jgi:hypothetical protein